jgi:tryptophanyl-tRNA synthetase
VAKKIGRAVTDSDAEVRYDPVAKPGVSNLLSILAACTGEKAEVLAARYTRYGDLKTDVADAVVELLTPIQARYAELSSDPGTMAKVLDAGAERARAIAAPTLAAAQRNIGLLLPGDR